MNVNLNMDVHDLNDEIESEGSELNSSRLSVAQHIAGQGDSEDSWIVYWDCIFK